jgi:hypothetical protein
VIRTSRKYEDRQLCVLAAEGRLRVEETTDFTPRPFNECAGGRLLGFVVSDACGVRVVDSTGAEVPP